VHANAIEPRAVAAAATRKPAESRVGSQGSRKHGQMQPCEFDFGRLPLFASDHASPTMPFQRAVTVAYPEDPLEREADRVADAVMSVRAPSGPGALGPTPAIGAPTDTSSSGGSVMDPDTRVFMEERFGHDFSAVKIHTGPEAARAARSVSARAFTLSRDIVFGAGEYQPRTHEGGRLLAHELTHVIQQGATSSTAGAQRCECVQDKGSEPDPATFAQGIIGDQVDQGEGPYVQSAACAAPRLPGISRRSPAVQRLATFAAGAVHETFNLASQLSTGGPAGFTPPLLNGAQILSPATARAQILRPTLNGRSLVAGGVEVWVQRVPTNVGSFDETVLAAPPWSTVTAKTNVAPFGMAACSVAGTTTFRAIGLPTDVACQAQNRGHEDHHALDHQTEFNNVMVPWDARLMVAQVLGTRFAGATQADAETALWSAMGGTPDQVADAQDAAWVLANNNFHSTAAGRSKIISNPRSDATCTTSSIDVT
jgi:hypothetical protein